MENFDLFINQKLKIKNSNALKFFKNEVSDTLSIYTDEEAMDLIFNFKKDNNKLIYLYQSTTNSIIKDNEEIINPDFIALGKKFKKVFINA